MLKNVQNSASILVGWICNSGGILGLLLVASGIADLDQNTMGKSGI